MQSSNLLSLRCSAQNQVSEFCVNSKCMLPSAMCGDAECRCYLNHTHCILKVSLDTLLELMTVKGDSAAPLFTSILEWYYATVKTLNIDIDALKTRIADAPLCLRGREGGLYELMLKGEANKIQSDLVADVVASLQSQPLVDIDEKQKEIGNRLAKMVKNIQKRVDQARQMWMPEELTQTPLTFSQELCSPCLECINGNRLEVVKYMTKLQMALSIFTVTLAIAVPFTQALTFKTIKYGLLMPSVEFRGLPVRRHHRFRIVNTNPGIILFGICHKNSVINRGFECRGTNYQCGYLVNTQNGQIFSQSENKNGKNYKSSLSKLQENEIIEVTFDHLQRRVTFQFLNRRQTESTTVLLESDNNLHLCVIMQRLGDKVEYLGEKME